MHGAPTLGQRFVNRLRHSSPAVQTGAVLLFAGSLGLNVLSVAANIVQIFGEPWPTEPIFVPGPYSADAPFDIPFIVSNRSSVWPMKNPSFACRAIKLRLTEGQPPLPDGVILAGPKPNPPNADIQPGRSAPALCAARHIRFIGVKVKAAKISLLVEYDSVLPWRTRITAESPVFVLNTSLAPPQWMEGDLME